MKLRTLGGDVYVYSATYSEGKKHFLLTPRGQATEMTDEQTADIAGVLLSLLPEDIWVNTARKALVERAEAKRKPLTVKVSAADLVAGVSFWDSVHAKVEKVAQVRHVRDAGLASVLLTLESGGEISAAPRRAYDVVVAVAE